MSSAVYVKTYEAPVVDRREILRYAGVRGENEHFDAILDECLEEARGRLIYKVCYREFPIIRRAKELDMVFSKSSSETANRFLEGCDRVVLFGATVGLALDRLIAKYSRVAPSKAIFFQAYGAERIEALCDRFSADIAQEKRALGQGTRRRFSPGYGDLSLALQRDIFAALDCSRKIGLSLNDSLLMSPSKSVTALIGVTDGGAEREEQCCDACEKQDCAYR